MNKRLAIYYIHVDEFFVFVIMPMDQLMDYRRTIHFACSNVQKISEYLCSS